MKPLKSRYKHRDRRVNKRRRSYERQSLKEFKEDIYKEVLGEVNKSTSDTILEDLKEATAKATYQHSPVALSQPSKEVPVKGNRSLKVLKNSFNKVFQVYSRYLDSVIGLLLVLISFCVCLIFIAYVFKLY